jgi:hypothetical protein
MEKVSENFIETANDVCCKLEKFDLHDTDSLQCALIKLLFEANNLTQLAIKPDDVDLAGDVVLPEVLNDIPDDLVFYVVFDPNDQKSLCALTLKNALGDIYKSLRRGLQALENEKLEKTSVLWHWRFDFQFHWGRHLIDVIRFFFLCYGSNENLQNHRARTR